MKTGEQFLKDIYEKADVMRAKEAEAAVLRKKRMKLVTGLTAAAACVMIAVGVSALPGFMASDGAAELAARYEENGTAAGSYDDAAGISADSADNPAEGAEGIEQYSMEVADGTNSGGSSDSSDSFDGIAAYSSDTADKSRKTDEPSYPTGQKNGACKENDGSAANDAEKSGKSGKSNDSSDSNDSSEQQFQTQAYYFLPARVLIEDRDGNAEALTGGVNDVEDILREVYRLSDEGKAVSAKLGEPVPVENYIKRVICVALGEENADGTLRLDDYNSENTVWYIIEE